MLGKRISPPPPQNQSSEYKKVFEDSELGELIVLHFFFSITDFFQTPFVHKASCIFINMRVCESMIVHLKSKCLHTHAAHLGLKKGDKKQLISSSICMFAYYKMVAGDPETILKFQKSALYNEASLCSLVKP